MLDLNRYARRKSVGRKATLLRQIAATDAAIERLVCSLYGLKPEEIADKEIAAKLV